MGTDLKFEVELPRAVGFELFEQGLTENKPVDTKSLGALPEIAAFAVTFAGDAAVLVTLLQGPATVKAIVRSLLARRSRASSPYWLRVRGPGGQAQIELNDRIDPATLEGLLTAIWQVDADATENTRSLDE